MLSITLHFATQGRSDLTILVDDLFTLRRSLEGRYARAIFAAQQARDADAQLPDDVRGFRTAAEFGELLGKAPGGRNPVRPVGVKNCLYELRRILREEPRLGEVGRLLPSDDVFETRRGKGYRLSLSSDVVIHVKRQSTKV